MKQYFLVFRAADGRGQVHIVVSATDEEQARRIGGEIEKQPEVDLEFRRARHLTQGDHPA
jgi:hypothetical protein